MKDKNAYILLYHRADNETSSACPTLDQLHSAMSQESQDFDGLLGELDDDDEGDDNIDRDDNYVPGSYPVDELAEELEDDDDENNADVDDGCAPVSQGVHELDNQMTSQQDWWMMMRRTKLTSTTSVHPDHMTLMILREN